MTMLLLCPTGPHLHPLSSTLSPKTINPQGLTWIPWSPWLSCTASNPGTSHGPPPQLLLLSTSLPPLLLLLLVPLVPPLLLLLLLPLLSSPTLLPAHQAAKR